MKGIMDSLQKHMEMLCGSVGARPTGSAANKAAVDYVAEVLRQSGLAVHRQEFDCMDWQNAGAMLMVGSRSVPAEAAEYSLPCDVEAEFLCVDTGEMLQSAALDGKIAVLHGDLCKEPLMPKNFTFYNPEEHKRIIALLEEKNPAAVITVTPTKEHVIQDGDFHIPCAVVSEELLDVFTNSAGEQAKLTINTERIDSKAHNVIAAYGDKKEKICFSAHIDTKPATPGALDNASGVSILLALAETLSGKEYPFQIEIVLFNGEDYYSTPGEMTFMASLSPDYILAVNVDGIGLKNSDTSVSFYSCAPEMEDRIMQGVGQQGGITRIEPWPMGDHMLFAAGGIPTVAVTAANIFGLMGSVIHSADDNMDQIDMSVLADTVPCLASLIDTIGNWKAEH